MKHFYFETSAGIFDSRELNILINKIHRSATPPIKTPQLEVGTKAGAYTLQNKLSPKVIAIDITLMSLNDTELRSDIRTLAGILYRDKGEGNLFLSDEIDKFYKVKLTGDTDIEAAAAMGEITLEFIAGDPYAYSAIEKKITVNSDSEYIHNGGTAPTYPIIRLTTQYAQHSHIYQIFETEKKIELYHEDTIPAGTYIIDHEKNLIYPEGVNDSRMHYLTLESDFFALETGTNTFKLFGGQTGNITAEIFFRERYL